jgi:hypothetical protein
MTFGVVGIQLGVSPAKGILVHDRYVRFNALVLETRRPRVDIHGCLVLFRSQPNAGEPAH